jgi:hypothetical protein
MSRIAVLFKVHSYWHVGTGRGAGPGSDAVVARTAGGLPYLPGKAVKGLLREAVEHAELLGVFPDGSRSTRWFGTGLAAAVEDADAFERNVSERRYTTDPGALRFTSATIGATADLAQRWERWSASSGEPFAALRRSFASTKISERGVVEEKTLRSIEVIVPVTLRAEVWSDDPDVSWVAELPLVFPFVDGIGGHRTRGLGRVTVESGE